MTGSGKAPAARTRPALDPKRGIEKVQRVPPPQLAMSLTPPWTPAPIPATETPAPEKGGSLKAFRTEIDARVKAGTMTREQGDQVLAQAQERVRLPFNGRLTSSFGERRDPISRKLGNHPGVDIPVVLDTPVPAVAEGQVVQSTSALRGFGNLVVIDHGTDAAGNRVYTLYAHNNERPDKAGGHVEAGEAFAKAGSTGHSTGSHLHYEVRVVPPGGPTALSGRFTGKYSVDPEDYVWPDLTPAAAPKQ